MATIWDDFIAPHLTVETIWIFKACHFLRMATIWDDFNTQNVTVDTRGVYKALHLLSMTTWKNFLNNFSALTPLLIALLTDDMPFRAFFGNLLFALIFLMIWVCAVTG